MQKWIMSSTILLRVTLILILMIKKIIKQLLSSIRDINIKLEEQTNNMLYLPLKYELYLKPYLKRS